jgi:surface-anchored protein
MRIIIVILALIYGILAAPAFATPIVYSGGHADIRANWNPATNPNLFTVALHADAGAIMDGTPLSAATEYAGNAFVFRVPAAANLGRIQNTTAFWGGNTSPPNSGYNFSTSTYDYTGAAVGDSLWVLSSNPADTNHYGTPWIGLGAEPTGATGWSSQIFFRLTSFAFDGSAYGSAGGQFSASTPSGSRRWDTVDGSFANDSYSVGPGSHAHPRFYFTEPGTYTVGITVTGTHTTFGSVSGTEVFTFQVVPEPGSCSLAILGIGGAAAGLLRRRISKKHRVSLDVCGLKPIA